MSLSPLLSPLRSPHFWPLIILHFLFTAHLAHGIVLPQDLDHDDRKAILETLGIPASSKLLTNPYPLGGYSGFEIGLAYEFLDTEEIATMGNSQATPSNLHLMELTFGKGLFNNVDLFFHFSPYNHLQNSSSYGGTVRWSFFQAKFLPVNMSLSAHSGTLHLGEQFTSQTLGVDFTTGFIVEDLSLYLGGGTVQDEAVFMGGAGSDAVVGSSDPDLVTWTQKASEKVFSEHFFVGLNVQFSQFFFVVQMDRYKQTIFSAKIGLRL